MNEAQHRRRLTLWLGSFPVMAAFVLLVLVMLLSDPRASEMTPTPVGLGPTHPADHASNVINPPSEPRPAVTS
ncbi:hypothetical protein ELQ88_01800 (plasmid) [Pseudomonas sp. MPC6]|nr:hypothetical protein ELQ88_01800 [Pseudomonas sp. MPC6]